MSIARLTTPCRLHSPAARPEPTGEGRAAKPRRRQDEGGKRIVPRLRSRAPPGRARRPGVSVASGQAGAALGPPCPGAPGARPGGMLKEGCRRGPSPRKTDGRCSPLEHDRPHRRDAGLQALSRASLGGQLRGVPGDRAGEAAGHAQRVPAPLRHDHQLRDRGVHRQQEEARPVQLLQGRARRAGRTRSSASTSRSCASCTCSRRRPRGTARSSASSSCTGPSARRRARSRACSSRASSTTRARPTARSTRSTGSASPGRASTAPTSDRFPSPMNEEPLRLIPPDWRADGDRPARPLERQVQGPRRRGPRPREPLHLQVAHDQVRGRLGEGRPNHVRVRRLVAQREGPRRHRHVPAEGREEPGLDRAHGRHQLPEDRRVRLGLRPARVQLRRRVQHRQPRHRSSSSRSSSSTSRSSTICSARRRSTRSSRRSSRRRTSTRSSSATRTRPSTRSS